MKKGIKWICGTVLIGSLVCIAPMQAFAASSSDIKAQINAYMADLETSQKKSESLQEEITAKQEEVGALYSEVETLNMEKAIYYEEMKTRIAYFYEEAKGSSLLSVLFGSDSIADFINRVQFQQALYDYDESQLNEYQALVEELEEKQATLDAEIENLGDMVEEQAILQATLNATIATKEQEYATAKAEEEAAAAAAAVAEKAAQEEKQKRASTNSVAYVSGGSGALTKSKGVVWYNGHKETYYSQRVLPGGNLNIPGRHVDERGVICDGDGYVCVASYDYPLGTIIETSLGMGKVYDWCATPGVIDIYTDW